MYQIRHPDWRLLPVVRGRREPSPAYPDAVVRFGGVYPHN
jgi:hypothetical protein